MKRIHISFVSLLVCALLCLAHGASAQLTKLNVGYVGVTSDNAAAFVARDTGIYAKNGLDVQLIYMNSGSTAVAALISADTPISQTAGPGVINAALNGVDTVMIAGGNVTLDYWMLSRPEIKTAEQLKGGAVAISRFGSASDFIVRYALQWLGLTPVKDVAILQVGSLTERLAAMETKRVQATVLAPPAMYQAQMRGFNMLADISALGLPYQATGVASTRKFIRERPDTVRRYIKAHVEAVHRFKTDRETSIKVLAKTLAITDKQLLERTYEGAIAEHKLPAKQYPTLDGLKTIMASEPKAKNSKAEDFADLRFIKELDDGGYFDKLYKK